VGAFKAANDITVTSNAGSLALSGDVESTAGSISLSGNGAGAAGTVTVGSVKADAGDVSISGNGAVTTGAVAGLGNSVAISGGGDVSTGETTAGSGVTITSVTGKVSLDGSVGTTDQADGTVSLTAVKGISQAPSMAITTGVLSAINTGSGDITLDSTANSLGDVNAVGVFAAKNTVAGGNVTFFHIGNLEIGSGEIDGISVNGGDIIVRQNTTGDISITQPILTNSVANTITLESFGEIRDSNQGRVASTRLVVRNLGGSGNILLDSVLNDADTIAIRNFATGFDILYVDATDLTVGIAGEGVRTDLGDITLRAGTAITAAAEVHAGQGAQSLPTQVGTTITFIATTGIGQTAAEIIGNNLVVTNVTGAVNLPSLTNDVEQLAALNLGGAITYNDVNDLETGVTRTEAGLPLGYEVVTSGALTLRAGVGGGTATPSILRVVSGLRYGSLALFAGNSGTGAVGTVEYVTTSTGDNAAPGPRGGFAGTLRDMITYGNENTARQTINGFARVQPQTAVFDELHYSVDTITLNAGLPIIVKPLSIDGTRVEAEVVGERVGINGSNITSTSVVNGLTYGAGSSDSVVRGLALYGFKTGAGISLTSGVNTVVNTYAGLDRDGAVPAVRNLVGMELNGRLSTKNTIGNVITDDTQANVIGGNTFAGVMVRGGASSNVIVGNLIGTNADGEDRQNLGDGVRIDSSNTNTVGIRTAQRPDLTAAVSNVIRFNGGSGIRITNASAATRQLGNFVENNLIQDNLAHGVHIVLSSQQTIGGSLQNQANVIGGQAAGAGIYMQSTTGTEIVGNRIGVAGDFSDIGNKVGIRLQASSGNFINTANQIGFNTESAIELLQGSNSNVVSGNYIGATIDENTDLSDAPNGGSGILIQQSLANQVVGGNLIASNVGTGVSIVDAKASNVSQGNVVGANEITRNGGSAGVLIQGGGYHTIGGGAGANIISLSKADGIRIEKGSLTGASIANVITGNYVGTNKFQEDLLGNGGYGISITYGGNNVVEANSVFNNGIDPNNNAATPEYDGIRITGSSANTIGSVALGRGNVVAGNGASGIVIADNVDVTGNGLARLDAGNARFSRSQAGVLKLNDVIVVGGFAYQINRIRNATTFGVLALDGGPVTGVAPTSFQIRTSVLNSNNVVYGNDVYDNVAHGVTVSGSGTKLVTIGQQGTAGRAADGAVNAIRNNGGYGVFVTGTGGVTIQGNSISGNGGLDEDEVSIDGGIRLANGANAGAVAPTVLSAVVEDVSPGNTKVTVSGTVATLGSGTVTVANGRATFSVAQTLVRNDLVVLAGKSYRVSAVNSATSVTLAGAPNSVASSFNTLKANQVNQQYAVDVYLNQPWLGDSQTRLGYQAAEFLGRATVVVSSNGTGDFTVSFSRTSSDTPLGMYVTATTTVTRPATGAVQYSTSEISRFAALVDLPSSLNGTTAADALARARVAAARASSIAGGAPTGTTPAAARPVRRFRSITSSH
jgi:hypothetical protein